MVFRNIIKGIVGDPNEREVRRYRQVVESINAFEAALKELTDEQLQAKTAEFRSRLEAGEDLDDLADEAFAVVREASVRTTRMRHFDVQMIGGLVLHEGKIAEMKTGEGKTLVATLPLYLNALTRKGAHLVTPNDYLSKVGLQTMGPIYHLLGLTAAVIQNAASDPSRGSFLYDPTFQSEDERYQNLRPISRREAYAADITYGTNNEFGFDYLRDNMVHGDVDKVQRGHHYAIVDEVDNILIDEARTPLIISGTADKPSDYYGLFARAVRGLKPSSQDSIDDKEPDGDYVEDLKMRNVYLSDAGVEKVEAFLRKGNHLPADSHLYSPENSEMIPYLDNSLRAIVIFQRDKDYIVKDKEVIIVDEFTGRLMIGRRFSEGLHQAIEAKEGVEVQRENLTLATITFQNYFRMYEKLAGMTGTAMTEADEFEEIYKLEVVAIPTNLPVVREDHEDLVFMNEKAKWTAVVSEIKERSTAGQPILVGTVAIETSERLSKLLERANVEHNVLNAKQHEREAIIIAQAGRPGSVTIATNMAGRGVDILLGGNAEGLAREKLRRQDIEVTKATPEQWQAALTIAKQEIANDREKVISVGGLHVIGTERHEARRIDNQLRGRAGRQGDPGSSRFYLSLEDDLMRRFGGDTVKNFMQRFNMPEEEPIENRMITGSIKQAQTRIEGYNFDIRKKVLEYDDVVNKQRQVIYQQRQQVLAADDLREQIERMTAEEIEELVDQHLPEDREAWEIEELYRAAIALYPVPSHINWENWQRMNEDEIALELTKGAIERYDELEARLGSEIMRMVERELMLRAIDQYWIRHLTDLDMLREGIGLQAYAQKDPLVEYKREAFNMWETLQSQIQQEVVHTIYTVQVNINPPPPAGAQGGRPAQKGSSPVPNDGQAPKAPNAATPNVQGGFSGPRNVRYSGAGAAPSRAAATAANSTSSATPRENRAAEGKTEPIRADIWEKTGRNDPCPCGSGKKYKNCHYQEMQARRQTVAPDEVKRTINRRRS
jgi:preprotein translocase subunit SecA